MMRPDFKQKASLRQLEKLSGDPRVNIFPGGIMFSGNKARFYVLPGALSFIFTGVIRIQTILERFFWHNTFALKTAVKLSF